MTWCNRYKQLKACKKEKSKELMPKAWHPTRWWERIIVKIDWAKIFKNTDLFSSSSNVTKLNKVQFLH